MRHTLQITVAASVSYIGAASARAPSLQDLGPLVTPASEVRVYVAKEFITMDPERPHAEAIAVRDGRFLAVGSLDEVTRAAGVGAVVDRSMAGDVVIAGFVEQHVHPVLAALTMNTKVISIEDWDAIDGFSAAVRDEGTYAARLRKALAAHNDKTKPFLSWGYHHYFHGSMSRRSLNELAPDLPVIIWHRSCHEFYLNDKALEVTGIDKTFVDAMPQSARDQIDLGQGHFFEQGAIAILGKIAPIIASKESFKVGLEFTERYYHRNGITVACEPGGFLSKPMQEAINAVYSDEATPFNHYFIADGKSFAARHPQDAAALVKDTATVLDWGSGRTRYLPKQVKLLTDGAIYSQLMMMRDGYTDGHHGAWIMDPPLFDYCFQAYWDAGYQIHIHNNGDGGLDVLLDSLEKAMRRSPRKDHRTVLVHFGFAAPEQVEKWAKLGGIVSANPYYVTALAGRYGELGIGPKRSANMVPMGEVVKHGMSFSFHSDMPMAPAKPMQLVWAGVNRLTAEGTVVGPEHRVTVEQALRAMTIDAAYSIQLENQIGSITPGKLANLTVLDRNPHATPTGELKDVTVRATVLEGRLQPVPHSNGRKDAETGSLEHGRQWRMARAMEADDQHSHDAASHTGGCCSCAMNREFAARLFAETRCGVRSR